MKKIVILLLIIHFSNSYMLTSAKFNKEHNNLEFISEVEIINQKTNKDCNNCCKVFTPIAPYNNVSCVITAPNRVCVGQPFMVDFALNVRSATYISFWADLLPSHEQMIAQGLKLVNIKAPTVGIFDKDADSVANQGGRGMWRFEQGIPAGTYHITFTFIAQSEGIKSFTSLLATNPPSYIKVMDIISVDEVPLAQNDVVNTYDNQTITIPVLDNDYGHTALMVKEVSKPTHGIVIINPDQTLTYTPKLEFEGVDHFVYTVQDLAGNKAKACVDVHVCKCPSVQVAN